MDHLGGRPAAPLELRLVRRSGAAGKAFLLGCIAIGVLSIGQPASAGAAAARRGCRIQHGWKIVAQDSYAVVALTGGAEFQSSYCSRAQGRFRPLPVPYPCCFQLRGRYVAVESSPQLDLIDTSTGKENGLGGGPGAICSTTGFATNPPFVLSPNGIAARIVTYCSRVSSESDVEVVPIRGTPFRADSVGLTPTSSNPFANLALYDCAAGCGPGSTIVAWTNNGSPRYTVVNG